MSLDEFFECHCSCHSNLRTVHIMACCNTCPHCRKRIQLGRYQEHEKECGSKFLRQHIRNLADSRCKAKHRDYYDSMICVGPNEGGFGPPCDSCLEETRRELEQKRGKAQGRELSPEEAAKVRKRLEVE